MTTGVINEAINLEQDVGNINSRFEVAFKMNEHFQSLILFADSKANFVISLSLGLLAGNLAILSYNINILKDLIISFKFMDGVFISVYSILIILIVIYHWIVFNDCISVVSPNSKNASKKSSVFFFGEVASLNHDDFKEKFFNKTESGLFDDLIYQVYDKAYIAKIKFDLITKSANSLKILLILTILHPFINIILNLI